MKQITDELTGNLEILYKINEDAIKSFESQNRNYEILKNVNEINYHDQIIIDDINSIVNNNKLINIIQMYNKIKGFQNIETIYTKEGQSKNQNIIPISKNNIIKMYNNIIKYVCGIKIEISGKTQDFFQLLYNKVSTAKGTGFFAKIPYNSKKLHVLITDSKCLGVDEILKNVKIKLAFNDLKTEKHITLDDNRKRYVNEKLDITIIEIKKDDGIKFFYELDSSLLRHISDNNREISRLASIYNNESIYSINYGNEDSVFISQGLINNFSEKEIKCDLDTKKFKSGGPIAFLDNNNIIGINNESRISLIEPIYEFQTIQNNLLIIKKEEPNDKLNNNNIIIDENRPLNEMELEYSVKKNDKEIDIFGEIFVKNNRDNCKLIIDNKEQELTDVIKIEKNNKKLKSIKLILKEIKPITNMSYMFDNSDRLISSNVTKWDTTYVDDMSYMFNKCESLTKLPDISTWNTKNVKNMSYMFYGCEKLTSLPDIFKWNTSSLIKCNSMFYRISSLKSLPNISIWDTKNVTDMSKLFGGCQSLKSFPDISKWIIKNVIDMSHMFEQCESIQSLPDIGKWDIKSVINMGHLFDGCSKLSKIPDISKWDLKNVKDISYMFNNCSSLTALPKISKWDTTNITDISYLFASCEKLTSLPDISIWNTKNITNMKALFQFSNGIKYFPDFFNGILKK